MTTRNSLHCHAQRSLPGLRGMTLVEVLAVVVILGMLATALAVGLSGRFGRATHEIAKTSIAFLSGQVETFKLETQRLPTSSEGLQVLTDKATASYYTDAGKLIDPWGNNYMYMVPGPDGRPFEIISYGADGQPGGDGENADLSSARLGETAK